MCRTSDSDFRHDAGNFAARSKRHFRLDLVFAGNRQRIGKAEADGVNAQSHLPGFSCGAATSSTPSCGGGP